MSLGNCKANCWVVIKGAVDAKGRSLRHHSAGGRLSTGRYFRSRLSGGVKRGTQESRERSALIASFELRRHPCDATDSTSDQRPLWQFFFCSSQASREPHSMKRSCTA